MNQTEPFTSSKLDKFVNSFVISWELTICAHRSTPVLVGSVLTQLGAWGAFGFVRPTSQTSAKPIQWTKINRRAPLILNRGRSAWGLQRKRKNHRVSSGRYCHSKLVNSSTADASKSRYGYSIGCLEQRAWQRKVDSCTGGNKTK